jgi:hypothetical protein
MEGMVSVTYWPLYPQGKSSPYPLDRRLGGPQSPSGRDGEEKNSQPLSRLEPSIIQPIAHRYISELSRILLCKVGITDSGTMRTKINSALQIIHQQQKSSKSVQHSLRWNKHMGREYIPFMLSFSIQRTNNAYKLSSVHRVISGLFEVCGDMASFFDWTLRFVLGKNDCTHNFKRPIRIVPP